MFRGFKLKQLKHLANKKKTQAIPYSWSSIKKKHPVENPPTCFSVQKRQRINQGTRRLAPPSPSLAHNHILVSQDLDFLELCISQGDKALCLWLHCLVPEHKKVAQVFTKCTFENLITCIFARVRSFLVHLYIKTPKGVVTFNFGRHSLSSFLAECHCSFTAEVNL